jgi:hypothetical protein
MFVSPAQAGRELLATLRRRKQVVYTPPAGGLVELVLKPAVVYLPAAGAKGQ